MSLIGAFPSAVGLSERCERGETASNRRNAKRFCRETRNGHEKVTFYDRWYETRGAGASQMPKVVARAAGFGFLVGAIVGVGGDLQGDPLANLDALCL